jgi:hypothetical protein
LQQKLHQVLVAVAVNGLEKGQESWLDKLHVGIGFNQKSCSGSIPTIEIILELEET